MAPVATNDKVETSPNKTIADLKAHLKVERFINPFNTAEDDDGDKDYEFEHLKPTYPEGSWAPLGDIDVTERALLADPEKKSLFAAAKKVKYLTPAIGVELLGVDLRQLSNTQKDELALLIAERGVVFFRNQEISVQEQLDLGRYYGPLHKHAAAAMPKDPALEELLVVYTDRTKLPDPAAFSKLELWHSDVTYEKQPPGITSLKGITIPDVGGDTLWTSGYALYSSLGPEFQKYLESLYALHTAVPQANETRRKGNPVRRPEIETIHPVVRVHPATGWKSIYVNPAFTSRIVGVPKVESDTILKLLYRQMAENPDFQVRFKWEKNSLAMWDNRIVHHTAIFDHWPAKRHALRVTPHAEKPLSVEEYERTTGKVAKDRQLEIWKSQGIEVVAKKNSSVPRGYND